MLQQSANRIDQRPPRLCFGHVGLAVRCAPVIAIGEAHAPSLTCSVLHVQGQRESRAGHEVHQRVEDAHQLQTIGLRQAVFHPVRDVRASCLPGQLQPQ